MAIVVEYGPISGALNLAAQAGKGQGYNIQASRDLQALQLQNSMQSEIDRTNATEMQDAMAQQNIQAQQAQSRAQMAQQAAYQRAQQQIEVQNAQANQQNAALTQQRLTQQEQAQQAQAAAALQARQDQYSAANDLKQQQIDEAKRYHDAAIARGTQAGAAEINAPVQANRTLLASLQEDAKNSQAAINQLQAQLSKTFDPEEAARLKTQIAYYGTKLSGVDPATGKKIGPSMDERIRGIQDVFQNFGSQMNPNTILKPNQQGGYDVDNTQKPAGTIPAAATPATPAAQPKGSAQATPNDLNQAFQQAMTVIGSQDPTDPAVKNQVRQLLQQQGLSLPTY